MELRVERRFRIGAGLIGALLIDRVPHSTTLERVSMRIPAGRYRVLLTPSARAKAGELWTPGFDGVLPVLVGVPGRAGVRIQAANQPEQLEGGNIAPGYDRDGDTLGQSREALRVLMTDLEIGIGQGPVWLEVVNPVGSVIG